MGKKIRQKLMLWLIPPLAWLISKFLFWSFKLTTVHLEELKARVGSGQRTIVAVWHSGALIMARFYHWIGYKPIKVLVSRSFDGQLAGRFLDLNGFRPVWGSSTRGGEEGLAEMIEWGRKGWNLAITPDGPRGPKEEVKPGAVRMAAALGAPIYPISFYCDPITRLKSWDQFIIPHPFARAYAEVGRAIWVPADADAETLEAKRKELEEEFQRLTLNAKNYFSSGPPADH